MLDLLDPCPLLCIGVLHGTCGTRHAGRDLPVCPMCPLGSSTTGAHLTGEETEAQGLQGLVGSGSPGMRTVMAHPPACSHTCRLPGQGQAGRAWLQPPPSREQSGDVLAVASPRCQLARKPHEGSGTRSSLPRPPSWLRLMVGTRGGQGSQGPFMCIWRACGRPRGAAASAPSMICLHGVQLPGLVLSLGSAASCLCSSGRGQRRPALSAFSPWLGGKPLICKDLALYLYCRLKTFVAL